MKDPSIPDPPNVLQYQDFSFNLLKKIGEGGFARCYEALETSSSRKFAIKAIHAESVIKLKAKNKLMNEIDIHYRLDHRHIVKLYKVFNDDTFIYLVMELCENKTLVDLLRRRKTLNEYEVKQFIWMILCAIKHLHSYNIIHRDLKLGNVFLNLESDVKIGDFGLATTLDQVGDRKKTICGTPNYIAPEILFDKDRGHSFEVDIWAIGIIMYTLLYGKPPFQSNEVKIIYKNIKHNSYIFPPNIVTSAEARDLIKIILTSNPDERPKLEDIFGHEFFRMVIFREPSSVDVRTIKQHCMQLSLNVKSEACVVDPDPHIISKENIPPKSEHYHQVRQTSGGISQQKSSLGGSQKEKKPSAVESVYSTLCHYLGLPLTDGVSPAPIDSRIVIDESDLATPAFYVDKWIDYSSKYGIGYLCANGNVGAYFNDTTIVLVNPWTHTFEYLYQEVHGPTQRILNKDVYSMDDYPPELNKKATIMNHFCGIFHKDKNFSQKIDPPPHNSAKNMDFVVKFAKVEDSIIFRLSTRSMQIIFSDNISLVLSNEGHILTIMDQNKESMQTIALADFCKLSSFGGNGSAAVIREKLLSFRNYLNTLLYQGK